MKITSCSAASFEGASNASLDTQLAGLRRQIEHIASSLVSFTQSAPCGLQSSPTLAGIYSSLVGSEIYPELARPVIAGISMRGENLSLDGIREALTDQIAASCRVDSTLGTSPNGRTVAVVGPPGSGKSTTLVKLAVRFGLAQRRQVRILTLDVERIAAADQLQRFASILNVGFQTVPTPAALAQTLHEHGTNGLVLIDTPGYGPKEQESAAALAAVFASEDIDVHLVLPASMKAVDLSSTVDRFAAFHPAKLLFTRLDETRTFGCIFNELARTGLPVSFLTNGQQIPEDLSIPTAAALTSLILNGLCGGAAAAA